MRMNFLSRLYFDLHSGPLALIKRVKLASKLTHTESNVDEVGHSFSSVLQNVILADQLVTEVDIKFFQVYQANIWNSLNFLIWKYVHLFLKFKVCPFLGECSTINWTILTWMRRNHCSILHLDGVFPSLKLQYSVEYCKILQNVWNDEIMSYSLVWEDQRCLLKSQITFV